MRGAVCIVSPGNLASNPRVLKEADALHEAGYAVTAVVCDYTEALRAFDDEIAAGARWNVVRVPRSSSERPIGMLAGSVAKLAGTHLSVAWAARAYGGPAAALTRAASGLPADLYIGHYIAGLAAAGRAARRRDAMLGFDAEDLHTGEGTELQARMVQTIEDVLLPSCHHVTAAAPMIGKAYHARYGVDPVTVLNVFPLAMAPTQPSCAGKGTFRAYWFSQTIGLDRGLQAFIQAMARVTTRVTLDIRGGDRWGHGDRLMELARELGVAEHVYMLPMAAPQEMVRLAADYDVGLSLETDVSESRRVCLTNKIFSVLGNSQLVSKVYFPRLIIPLAPVIVGLIDFAVSLVILFGVMAWYGMALGWHILLLPVFVALAVLVAIGPAMWAAATIVKYRDFRFVVPFVIQIGLYVSPVGFSTKIVPPGWQLLYSLNPLVGVIDGFRWAILGGESLLYMPGLALSLTVTAGMLWLAIHTFRHTERGFADVI